MAAQRIRSGNTEVPTDGTHSPHTCVQGATRALENTAQLITNVSPQRRFDALNPLLVQETTGERARRISTTFLFRSDTLEARYTSYLVVFYAKFS